MFGLNFKPTAHRPKNSNVKSKTASQWPKHTNTSLHVGAPCRRIYNITLPKVPKGPTFAHTCKQQLTLLRSEFSGSARSRPLRSLTVAETARKQTQSRHSARPPPSLSGYIQRTGQIICQSQRTPQGAAGGGGGGIAADASTKLRMTLRRL